MNRRFLVSAVVAVLVATGGAALGSGAYLYGKAQAGQWLMHRAWARTQASGHATRPWPWADTAPLARLIVPAQHIDLLVLAGASGRTLAWGPAHLDNSAALGAVGNAVISAHRDTHFRFLARIVRGDTLILERANGSRIVYRVSDIRIMDARTLTLPRDTERPTLTLITCYPFDALVPGGPLRYVVTAEADAEPPSLRASYPIASARRLASPSSSDPHLAYERSSNRATEDCCRSDILSADTAPPDSRRVLRSR